MVLPVILFFILLNFGCILFFKRKLNKMNAQHLEHILSLQNQLISEKNMRDTMNQSVVFVTRWEQTIQRQLIAIQLKLELLHFFSKTNLEKL
jgi:hypothetical protein